jgi:hypothetical protein
LLPVPFREIKYCDVVKFENNPLLQTLNIILLFLFIISPESRA